MTDDLRRSRLTVFFRAILAIPHLFWLYIWGIVAFLALIATWFATLFAGRAPSGLHEFLARYLRYYTHAFAYILLVAEPFPPFAGKPGTYPIDLEIDPPEPQARLATLFRIVLALPALLLAGALGYVAYAAAFFAWWVCLFVGRATGGLRNLTAYWLRYQQQTNAYFYLLTSRYPNADPLQECEAPVPASPPSSS